MKKLKKHAIGYNTVSSIEGVINTRGVKSYPNDLQIFGYTKEVGEGEKSPDNPYVLVSLDSGAMTVDGVDYEHSIKLTNNDTTIQVPVSIALNSVEGVSDYIYKDNGIWKLKQMCNKCEVDSNRFNLVSTAKNVFYAVYITDYQGGKQKTAISNSYTYVGNVSTGNLLEDLEESFCFGFNPSPNSYPRLYIKDTRYTTTADFRNYLQSLTESGIPLTIAYQLKNPVEHTLSDYAQDLLNSFTLQNHNEIWVEGYPDIKISGYLQKR